MTAHAQYTPGPANLAHIQKDRIRNDQGQEEEKWTLVVAKELRHPPEKVWQALTDPVHLREWAPFDADGNLGDLTTVKLTTVGAPALRITETTVTRAERPNFLEYNWGQFDMRWQLEATIEGTRLTLWINIARPYIAMGAAGWHVCLDVLDRHLSCQPIGRIAGPKAMNFEGWRRLHAEYAQQFGVEAPKWPPKNGE